MALLSDWKCATRRVAHGLLLLLAVGAGAAAADPGEDCDRRVMPGEDLQMALDGLPQNGEHQTVCLDRGIYHLQDMVTLERSNVTLRGQGGEATQLTLKDGASSPVLVLGDAYHQKPQQAIHQVTVEQLGIRGGGSNASEFRSDLTYLSNSGLIVRQGDGITLRNLDIQHCSSACLLTEYHSQNISIEHNQISHARWDGISLNRAGSTKIVGNTIESNTAAGITVEYLKDGEINDNVIADNGSHGMYLADVEHSQFSNNVLKGNQLAGAYLTCSIRSRDPVVCWDNSFSRDNTFKNNRFEHNQYGFQIGLDDVSNCLGFDTPPNISRGDTFHDSPNHEPPWQRYGRCIGYDDSKTVEYVSQNDTSH